MPEYTPFFRWAPWFLFFGFGFQQVSNLDWVEELLGMKYISVSRRRRGSRGKSRSRRGRRSRGRNRNRIKSKSKIRKISMRRRINARSRS